MYLKKSRTVITTIILRDSMDLDANDFFPGALYVLAGGMGGGKTSEFIHLCHMAKGGHLKVQVFTPEKAYRKELHEKFGLGRNFYVSRTGARIESQEIPFGQHQLIPELIDEDTNLFALAELPMFGPEFGDELVEIVEEGRREGRSALVDGLDKDYLGRPFQSIAILMALATNVKKRYGYCSETEKRCKRKGNYTQRFLPDGSPDLVIVPFDQVIKAGDMGLYEARCFEHCVFPKRE